MALRDIKRIDPSLAKTLIADDEYTIRLLYQQELTFEEYEVITVSDCDGPAVWQAHGKGKRFQIRWLKPGRIPGYNQKGSENL